MPRPARSVFSCCSPIPNSVLRPGQYGRARLLLDTKAGALLVPQRAVQELQGLYSVAVVGADNTVAFRSVKVGQRVDTLWVIEEGLKPGEKVVVEGLQRIQDGMTVTPKPCHRRGPARARRSRSWLASSSTGPSSPW